MYYIRVHSRQSDRIHHIALRNSVGIATRDRFAHCSMRHTTANWSTCSRCSEIVSSWSSFLNCHYLFREMFNKYLKSLNETLTHSAFIIHRLSPPPPTTITDICFASVNHERIKWEEYKQSFNNARGITIQEQWNVLTEKTLSPLLNRTSKFAPATDWFFERGSKGPRISNKQN